VLCEYPRAIPGVGGGNCLSEPMLLLVEGCSAKIPGIGGTWLLGGVPCGWVSFGHVIILLSGGGAVLCCQSSSGGIKKSIET